MSDNNAPMLPCDDEAAERAFVQIEELAKAAGRAKGRASALEHSRKAILSQEMRVAERKGFDKIGEQDREAHASGRYEQWLEDYEEAVSEAETLRLQVMARKMRFEYWRTRRADRRAEIGLL